MVARPTPMGPGTAAGNPAAQPTGRPATAGVAPSRHVAAADSAAAAPTLAEAVPQSEPRTAPIPLPVLAPPRTRSAPVPPPPAPTRPRPFREYVRHLSALQVLCWQVAALSVLLAVRQPWPVLVGTSVAAAGLLALTGARAGGRWLYELAGLAAAFLTRARRADLSRAGGLPGTALGLLDTLLPGATIRTVETSQGPAMVVSHRRGLTAQLKPPVLTPGLLATLPMPATLLPVVPDHLFGVQLVLHTGVRPDAPRRLVVAVHAARTVDVPVDTELSLVLRNAMRRVRRALDRAGLPAQPLDEAGALAETAGLAHVTGGRTEVREDWGYWRAGPVSQASFRLTGWGGLTDTQARGLVNGLLAGVPGVASTITLAAHTERRGDPTGYATLRLAATTEAAVDTAARHVTDRLAPSGVRLVRLDGAQLSGLAASLPIGVF